MPSDRTQDTLRTIPYATVAFLVLFAGLDCGARDQVIEVSKEHRFVVSVPEGFIFASARDARGFLEVRISAPDDELVLDALFAVSSDPKIETNEWQEQLHRRMLAADREFSEITDSGVRPLEPKTGVGVYSVSTDEKLVGLSIRPPDDYIYKTAGVRAWPGCCMVFGVLSNETTSDGYQRLFGLLKESFNPR
jgi:hypothetical protein